MFLLFCRIEISNPDNSESFPNGTRINPESQIFDLMYKQIEASIILFRRSKERRKEKERIRRKGGKRKLKKEKTRLD